VFGKNERHPAEDADFLQGIEISLLFSGIFVYLLTAVDLTLSNITQK